MTSETASGFMPVYGFTTSLKGTALHSSQMHFPYMEVGPLLSDACSVGAVDKQSILHVGLFR